eukprot:TRINITY_DN2474_c3_g1_i5.p1 TRINITY_DN2474_c3_g1~~TRINITY_DN2474_c3_g1_i5.p1  ORF type:complete len:350 (+),score=91.60 TRINITY_DN2474_c3_g1_i5:142-1050(+)
MENTDRAARSVQREEEETEEQPPPLHKRARTVSSAQDGDPNYAAAQAIRARLFGGAPKEDSPAATDTGDKEYESSGRKTVQVPSFDRFGRRLSFEQHQHESGVPAPLAGTKRRGPELFDAEGHRSKYFADDDVDLQTLIARERLTKNESYDTELARNLLKSKRAKLDVEDEYGSAETQLMTERHSAKSADKERQRMTQAAIRAHTREEKRLADCWFCMHTPNYAKHLTIALGDKVYLALPARGSIVEGHCILVPVQHVTSTVSADEVLPECKRSFIKTQQTGRAQRAEALPRITVRHVRRTG